jgi:hypothetical protein
MTDDDILALVGQSHDDKGQDSDDNRPSSSVEKLKSLSVPEMKTGILNVHEGTRILFTGAYRFMTKHLLLWIL